MNIEFKNITFWYNNVLPDKKPILENINFKIQSNEFIGLIGPTGSGKTTLIQLFTGLLKPSQGQVLIDGDDLFHKNTNRDLIRKRIGLAFQFPETQLFEETVYDDVSFAPKNFGFNAQVLDERVKTALQLVGLDYELLKNRSPFKLSEGEKRKTAIAGILAMDPEMLIFDEPTACLDAVGISNIEQLLTTLHKLGKTTLLVSHNSNFIAKLCERIIILNNGKIVFDGAKNSLFENEYLLKLLDIEKPRIFRYGRRLFEIEYSSQANIYTVDKLFQTLGG